MTIDTSTGSVSTVSNVESVDELISRGVEEIIVKSSFEKKLESGKKLRIKFGIDPTGPKIHLGRAIQFWKLKRFQDLGHEIILIIGDFTAMIGDASDKQAKRKPLTEEEIKNNLKTYKEQIGKILDLKKIEFHYNSEWLNKVSAKDLLKLSMKFTAQQMIQRRNFKERWDSGKEIGLHELAYPLLQGYDSMMVKSDIEIGGSDQLFNLVAGRKIQEIFNQKPQDIITYKMLSGLDGEKMSTSWGNVVNITDEPNDMYGKIMSMHDGQIMEYFELCTNVDLDEVKKVKNPRDQKARLAFEIVKMYHSAADAEKAAGEFDRVFKNREKPSEIPIKKLEMRNEKLEDLLVKCELASSKSEARRLIEQGAVEIESEKISDPQKIIEIKDEMVIKVGKRKFIKIKKD